MTLIVSNVGDNVQAPSATALSYIPDQLIAGNLKVVTQPIVLAAGTLPRSTVLGQQTSYSVEPTVGANTGNGTIGSLSAGVGTLVGTYVLTAKTVTDFGVVDPEGNALADATAGVAYAGGGEGLGFTLTAGATAFVAGDSFKLNVVNSIGNFITSVKTATDGSQVPCAILVDNTDASGGPVSADAYVMGEFNVNAISYDNSWTPELLATALRQYSIFLKGSVTAADPGTGAPALV